MKSMKRIFASMSAACAVVLAMMSMCVPAASAAEHPQVAALMALAPAAAPAPVDVIVATVAVEQMATHAFNVTLGVADLSPGAVRLLRAAPSSSTVAITHRIHADREAEGRTST